MFSFFWHRKRLLLGIILLVITGYLIWGGFGSPGQDEISDTDTSQNEVKKVEMFSFGSWQPESTLRVLGTLKSSGDIDVNAELSGTIAKTYVNIGDRVGKGQLLATFQKQNDLTEVSYQNAVRNLNTVQLSTENNVRSAENDLRTAELSLQQTQRNEQQGITQAYSSLITQARSARTESGNAIDWGDRIFGGSLRFRYQLDITRGHIGSSDTIGSVDAKNAFETLARTQDALENQNFSTLETSRLMQETQVLLNHLQALRTVIEDVESLIRRTPIKTTFSFDDREGFEAEAEALSGTIDSAITSLNDKIQAVRTQQESSELSILTAQNTVDTKSAALDVARASADNQIVSAQSQVSTALANRSDLEIRSPISGTVSKKSISSFDQVSQNTLLFSILSDETTPKITAYVTPDELERLGYLEKVEIEFPNKSRMSVAQSFVSTKIDPATQKREIQLPLDRIPEGQTVGSFVSILLPSQNGTKNLVPLSAISFEPDGAEVAVVQAGKVIRKKIMPGRTFGQSIEIRGGLEEGTQVIRYRNRVHAGERVESKR